MKVAEQGQAWAQKFVELPYLLSFWHFDGFPYMYNVACAAINVVRKMTVAITIFDGRTVAVIMLWYAILLSELCWFSLAATNQGELIIKVCQYTHPSTCTLYLIAMCKP